MAQDICTCQDHIARWLHWQMEEPQRTSQATLEVEAAIGHMVDCDECQSQLPALIAGLGLSHRDARRSLARMLAVARPGAASTPQELAAGAYLAAYRPAFERHYLSRRLKERGLSKEALPPAVESVVEAATSLEAARLRLPRAVVRLAFDFVGRQARRVRTSRGLTMLSDAFNAILPAASGMQEWSFSPVVVRGRPESVTPSIPRLRWTAHDLEIWADMERTGEGYDLVLSIFEVEAPRVPLRAARRPRAEPGKPALGVAARLYRARPPEMVGEYPCDAGGRITVPSLASGDYTVILLRDGEPVAMFDLAIGEVRPSEV